MERIKIAICGRTNVGKSTLFNALLGKRKAVVDDTPGVTRDLNYGVCQFFGKEFLLVDTGGLDAYRDGISKLAREFSKRAISESDVLIFVMDLSQGLTHSDKEFLNEIRRYQKPIFYVLNKADKGKEKFYEFFELGVDKFYLVSAKKKEGLRNLMRDVSELTKSTEKEEIPEKETTRVAIIGRPNVGKSLLLNRMAGYMRAIVSDIPGTTRDSIDTLIELPTNRYLVIDTAGLRRKSRVDTKLEAYSITRSTKAIEESDVVFLVIDGKEGVTAQDKRLASLVERKGKGIVIVVNKWDLVENREPVSKKIKEDLSFISYAPFAFVSALTGKRVHHLFELAKAVKESGETKIPTHKVTRFLREAISSNKISPDVKLYYCTQIGILPPTFLLFMNRDENEIKESYKRYIVNSLRKLYDFFGNPIRIVIKKR